jgi:hypothetical protein
MVLDYGASCEYDKLTGAMRIQTAERLHLLVDLKEAGMEHCICMDPKA